MSSVVSGTTRESIQQFVNEQVEAAGVEPDLIAPTATLDLLGLDSLDVVELAQSVKKTLGVAVVPRDFDDAVTLADAVDVIAHRAEVA